MTTTSNAADEQESLSVSCRLGHLQFHHSGKFRVVQFSDVEEAGTLSIDAVRLIEATLDAVRPDLAVFTGNMIAGYDPSFAPTFCSRRWNLPGEDELDSFERQQLQITEQQVRQYCEQLVAPLVARRIPWVVTFGNHDFQCGISNARLNDVLRSLPGCINPPSSVQGAFLGADSWLPRQEMLACEPGTLALAVKDMQGEQIVGALVLIDSGDYDEAGGYGCPSSKALQFLRQVGQEYGVPYTAFQHFPVNQYYQLLKPVSATADRAIEGYRSYAGRFFVLDERLVHPGGYLDEGISCPDADAGEFSILRQTHCSVLAAGHDHRNGFAGEYADMLMVATPTCGFTSYGPTPDRRAARVFEYDIRHPYEPRTQLLEYGELVGKPSSQQVYTYALNATRRIPGEEVDLLKRPSWLARLMALLRQRRR